jgi:Holliday junction DNA helicase RuvB
MREHSSGSDVSQIEPVSLTHIKGQRPVISALQIYLRAYFNVRLATANAMHSFGPVILTGPSGTGKTMVAKALHAELGNLRLAQTNGETLNKRAELFATLLNADQHTTIFIDEAQGMNRNTQHILLTAISERQLPLSTDSPRHGVSLDPFSLILATTHEYLLQEALRNRMRVYCRFEYYSVDDLVEIVRQRVQALRWECESPEILRTIAQRAKGTARQALNRNLQMCWQVAKSHDRDLITSADLDEAFHHLQIDEFGLEDIDRRYLRALAESGHASLNVLSAKLGLPSRTIQDVVEPYLIRASFVTKERSSVRVLSEQGRNHLRTTRWSS